MKRKLLSGALALMLVLSLAACGASSSRAASTVAFMSNKAAPPVPASPAAAPPDAGAMAADAAGIAERGEAAAVKANGADAALSARKIVRNAALVLETKEFERALSELARMVTDAG
ncbi:MAG: hypothetical protein RR197_03435, partial [Oscillospiraceae bacterium]